MTNIKHETESKHNRTYLDVKIGDKCKDISHKCLMMAISLNGRMNLIRLQEYESIRVYF